LLGGEKSALQIAFVKSQTALYACWAINPGKICIGRTRGRGWRKGIDNEHKSKSKEQRTSLNTGTQNSSTKSQI
jgi:hypothetical protein